MQGVHSRKYHLRAGLGLGLKGIGKTVTLGERGIGTGSEDD
jgi:hypothetical protein